MKRLAIVALLVPATAAAEEPRAITLEEAVATALRQNDTVLAEAVDVDIAAATYHAAVGADDVLLEADVAGLTRQTEPIDGPFFQETSVEAVSAALSLWKPLATGGRIGVSVRDDVTRSTIRVASTPGAPVDLDYTVHGPRAELVVVQPLLRGRGPRAAHAARRVAAADRDAQAAELERARTALVHDVTVTYWELAYAAREVAIRESSLALAREQLEVTRARADVGKGSELEVLAVEQAIAAREAALLGARQAVNARALALRVLMAEEGDARPLTAADALDSAPRADAGDALGRALRFSPDLHVLAEHARAAAVEREATRQDLLPALDLVVRGGPAGNAEDAGDAFSQLGRFDSYAAQAMLTFSIPLGNRTAEGRHAAARLREKRLGHAADEVRGQLTAAVQRATDAIALAEQQIVAAEKAAELARRNVDLELARWKAGSGTNFDVLERQDQLAAADAALARARADHRIALARLASLTGPATVQ